MGAHQQMLLGAGSGGSSAWDPTQLSNPAAFICDHLSSRTDDGAGLCTQWNDRSGNGNHFVQAGVSSVRPTIVTADTGVNNLPTLEFDGTADFMQNTATVTAMLRNSGSFWAFILYRNLTSSAAARNLLSASTPTAAAVRWAAQASRSGQTDKPTLGVRRLDADSFASVSAATAISTSYGGALFRMDYTNGDGFVDVNGTQADASNTSLTSTGSTSNTASSVNIVLASDSPLTNYANCRMMAAVGGQTLPTSADIDRLFGYYFHAAGIAALLPALHPYKTNPP